MNRRRTPTDGRTEEVSTRAPIKSLIFLDFFRGVSDHAPHIQPHATPAQLARLQPGGVILLRPPRSKTDQFGEIHCPFASCFIDTLLQGREQCWVYPSTTRPQSPPSGFKGPARKRVTEKLPKNTIDRIKYVFAVGKHSLCHVPRSVVTGKPCSRKNEQFK